MNFFDVNWDTLEADPIFISGDGDYTLEIKGSNDSPYGVYLDMYKILKDNPNIDIVIKDIKVDGTSIDFDDEMIDRVEGDDPTTARRYILNPWGANADDAPKYMFNSSLTVTITVKMDTGNPFITEDE